MNIVWGPSVKTTDLLLKQVSVNKMCAYSDQFPKRLTLSDVSYCSLLITPTGNTNITALGSSAFPFP